MMNQDKSMLRFKVNQNDFWWDCDELNMNVMNNRVRKEQQKLIHPESSAAKNQCAEQKVKLKQKIKKKKSKTEALFLSLQMEVEKVLVLLTILLLVVAKYTT